MTIIDAIKHLDGPHLKEFIESFKESSSPVVIVTNATMAFQLEFKTESFIEDFLNADVPEINGLSGHDEILLINDETVLKTSVNDFKWYNKSTRRINKLLDEVYDRKPEPAKKPARVTKAMMLAEKAEEMKKERIFALMIADKVDEINAFKGTGQQCLDWLNRQLVVHYDKIDEIKLHLNLTESSSISEFKTINELIEEGSLIV